MSWLLLPADLKLNILRLFLASPSAIDHSAHVDNLVCGDLETLVSTNNTELAKLSSEAYYKSNTFIIKPETTFRGFKEIRTFRPREQHLQIAKHIDESAPASPAAGVISPADSGVDVGCTAADLASALEKAASEQDPAAERAARQRKLFDLFNSKEMVLRSQRKIFRQEFPLHTGDVICQKDPFSLA